MPVRCRWCWRAVVGVVQAMGCSKRKSGPFHQTRLSRRHAEPDDHLPSRADRTLHARHHRRIRTGSMRPLLAPYAMHDGDGVRAHRDRCGRRAPAASTSKAHRYAQGSTAIATASGDRTSSRPRGAAPGPPRTISRHSRQPFRSAPLLRYPKSRDHSGRGGGARRVIDDFKPFVALGRAAELLQCQCAGSWGRRLKKTVRPPPSIKPQLVEQRVQPRHRNIR
jgi:hypothetical protein